VLNGRHQLLPEYPPFRIQVRPGLVRDRAIGANVETAFELFFELLLQTLPGILGGSAKRFAK
jgi:hypothetical protein